MSKLTIAILIYILGIVFGSLFWGIWDAETSFVKTMSVFVWTIIFLITLFYTDKYEKKKLQN
jgi:hypothetical protein